MKSKCAEPGENPLLRPSRRPPRSPYFSFFVFSPSSPSIFSPSPTKEASAEERDPDPKYSSNKSLSSNLCFICHKNRCMHCFPGSQKVKDLPGVGWSLGHKLQTLGVETCADLQKFSSQALQREFGPKTGLQLYQYCRGIDDRTLKTERERKSVSAEINYGIRFTKVRLISRGRVSF